MIKKCEKCGKVDTVNPILRMGVNGYRRYLDCSSCIAIVEDNRERLKARCSVCEGKFTPQEWENRHQPHEPGCPGIDKGCECDLVAHENCCPDCNEQVRATDAKS